MRRLFLLAAVIGLQGCTLIPEYTRPGRPVPASLHEVPPSGVSALVSRPAAELSWDEFFTDARLREVVSLALDNNRDVRVAALNVQKAQALYRIQRAELYPGVGVLAGGSRSAFSSNDETITSEQYSVDAGFLSWELDLFGRIRSQKRQALENYLSTESGWAASQISLIAATAAAYLTLAADLENLHLAQASLEAQEATVKLVQASRDAQLSSDLDLSQARSQAEAARADVASFSGRAAQARSALDLVVGTHVPSDLLPANLSSVRAPRDIRAGLSSDVLLGRPDILAAEHQLKAANANIGAARAAFFPTITLTGATGTQSPDLSRLFDAGTGTWTFSTQILAPVFTGGARRAGVQVAEVDRKIAVARYEKAIQVAYKEVIDALTLRASLVTQREALATFVDALGSSHRLSQARYEAGIDSYLGVLVSQQALVRGRQALVGVQVAEQLNRVNLYKALGGGVRPQSDGMARADSGSGGQ